MFALRPTTIVVTNLILSIVFLSRAAFDLVSGLGAVTISLPPNGPTEQTAVFAGFTGWEILPILLLFLTLASERERSEAIQTSHPSFGIFGVIEEAGKENLELSQESGVNGGLEETGAFTPIARGGRSRKLDGNGTLAPSSAYSGETESRMTSYSFVYENDDMAHAMHEALLRQQQEEERVSEDGNREANDGI